MTDPERETSKKVATVYVVCHTITNVLTLSIQISVYVFIVLDIFQYTSTLTLCISEPNKSPFYDSRSPAKLIHGCFKSKE